MKTSLMITDILFMMREKRKREKHVHFIAEFANFISANGTSDRFGQVGDAVKNVRHVFLTMCGEGIPQERH